jgi:D-alanine-D-alanine ligase
MWRNYGGEVLAQEFIQGYDVSVSFWGNRNPKVFEPRRLWTRDKLAIATERVKFDKRLQRRKQIRSVLFQNALDGRLKERLKLNTRKLFTTLDLSGYARMDFRIDREGKDFLLDVNANPNLARNEDFALSAMHEGIDYESLLRKIMNLAVNYKVSI